MAVPQAYSEPAPLETGAEVHHAEHLHAIRRNGILLPHHADLAKAEGFDQLSTTAMCGIGLWVAVAAGVFTRANSSRVSLLP